MIHDKTNDNNISCHPFSFFDSAKKYWHVQLIIIEASCLQSILIKIGRCVTDSK